MKATRRDMRLLIGIPTYNRVGLLINLLLQIGQQVGSRQVDLLIVDNDPGGSAEIPCRQLVRQHGWTYMREERRGVSHVRNCILNAFTESFDALIMIDDDQQIGAGWLDSYITGLRRWPNEILAGNVSYIFPESCPEEYVANWYSAKEIGVEGIQLSSTGTGNVVLPRSLWKAAGYPRFDPRFGLIGGEDTDFFKHITDMGGRIRSLKSAQVNELVCGERTTREWVRKRTVRQGEIRGAMAHFEGDSFQAILGGLARLVVGGLHWMKEAFRGRPMSAQAEGKLLTGFGYIKGSMGIRSRIYGDSR